MSGRRWIALSCAAALLLQPGAAAARSADALADSTAAPATARGFLAPVRAETGGRRLGLALSGAGLALGIGVGVWLKAEADDRYDLYLRTADPDRAREYFDSAERHDRASLAGWVVAQVAFVAFFHYLTREEPDPLIPTEGEPLVRVGEGSVEVGWRISP